MTRRTPFDPSLPRPSALGEILATLLLASTASGQCTYEMTVLFAPPCPPFGEPPSSLAQSINELGAVAGYHPQCLQPYFEAFYWSEPTGFVTIERPDGVTRAEAHAINDAGLVVGHWSISDDGFGELAFIHDIATGMTTTLGTLPGGNYSKGLAINDQGQVAGYWGNNNTGPIHGYLWQDGVMTDLGAATESVSSRVYGLNEHGDVTGWRREEEGGERIAFVLMARGKLIDLGPIPGGFTSIGRAINDHLDVVGEGQIDDGDEEPLHAFLWSGGVMVDLGVAPGAAGSAANDINNRRQVVGTSQSAVLWQKGVMHNLTLLVENADNLIAVTNGYAISEQGVIAGRAKFEDIGSHACILTPIDPPATDLDGDCVTNEDDLLRLLEQWGSAGDADFDGSGVVDGRDLGILLAGWG